MENEEKNPLYLLCMFRSATLKLVIGLNFVNLKKLIQLLFGIVQRKAANEWQLQLVGWNRRCDTGAFRKVQRFSLSGCFPPSRCSI